MLVNILGYCLDEKFLLLYFIQRAEHTTARIFFLLRSSKTDVDGPAQPRYLRPLAVKSDECQNKDFLCYFQMKPQTPAAHCVCFYCGNALEDPWCFFSGGVGALLRTTCSHSRSRDGGGFSGGRGFSSGTAPRRQTTETRPTPAGEGNFTPVGRGTDTNGDKPLDVTLLLRRSNSKIRKTNYKGIKVSV